MPEPHSARGEVSETDVRSPAPDGETPASPALDPDRARSDQDEPDQVADTSEGEPREDAESVPAESAIPDAPLETVTEDDDDDPVGDESDVTSGATTAEPGAKAGASAAAGSPATEMTVSGTLPTAGSDTAEKTGQLSNAEPSQAEAAQDSAPEDGQSGDVGQVEPPERTAAEDAAADRGTAADDVAAAADVASAEALSMTGDSTAPAETAVFEHDEDSAAQDLAAEQEPAAAGVEAGPAEDADEAAEGPAERETTAEPVTDRLTGSLAGSDEAAPAAAQEESAAQDSAAAQQDVADPAESNDQTEPSADQDDGGEPSAQDTAALSTTGPPPARSETAEGAASSEQAASEQATGADDGAAESEPVAEAAELEPADAVEDVSAAATTGTFPAVDSEIAAGPEDSGNAALTDVENAAPQTAASAEDVPVPPVVDTRVPERAGAEPDAAPAEEDFPSAVPDAEQQRSDVEQVDVETTGPDLALGSTQQFSRIPPETETERTQQLRPVTDTGPVPRVAPPESATERTSRIDLGGALSGSVPGADGGPATEHIPVVEPGAAAETQQFARPDVAEPRWARPEDFLVSGTGSEQAWADGDVVGPDAGDTGSVSRAGEQPPPEPDRFAPAPRKRRRWPIVAVAAAVVLLLGVGVTVGPKVADMASGVEDPPPPVRLDPQIRPLSGNAPLPQQSGVAQQLGAALRNPAVGELGGTVMDARTGQAVWQQQGDRPMIPASNGKLFTVSAALLALDHEQRFSTKIVRGSTPGSVVLVGGGDPTLSALPAGQESVYPGAARVDDLVKQVNAATGGQVSSVQVDTSRYTGPPIAPGWLPEDVKGGYVAPVEPVMLDGDRQDPAEDTSPRTDEPALGAAQEVAGRLGTTQVSEGAAPPGAEVLGEVRSPTVRELSEILLQHSDNVLAETLGREVAIATGNEPSFAGATRAVEQVLQRNGLSLGPTKMVDGSGLSLDDRASSAALAGLFAKATEPPGPGGQLAPEVAKLRSLLPGLPVAGGSGSLATRFQDGEGRGWVRAKTGTLDGANSLAGTVLTEDGRLLVFTLLSNGTSSTEARPALDRIAAQLSGCGCA